MLKYDAVMRFNRAAKQNQSEHLAPFDLLHNPPPPDTSPLLPFAWEG